MQRRGAGYESSKYQHASPKYQQPRTTPPPLTVDLPRRVQSSPMPQGSRSSTNLNVITPGGFEKNVTPAVTTSENVGRWSAEEHEMFLEGLKKHGKLWKTIATSIGTRTVVQVRTHAQKYFQKLERKLGGGKPSVAATNKKTHAVKRKSLPASLPSRKKMRSPKKAPPRISLSLGNLSTSSLDMPQFSPSSSCSSDSLSANSPTGIAELEDLITGCWSSKESYCQSPSLLVDDHNSNSKMIVGDINDEDFGEDPLEWLIDGGLDHLPESSLEHVPVFPDSIINQSSLEQQPQFQLQPKESQHDPMTTFDPLLGIPILPDAKMTVQALFE